MIEHVFSNVGFALTRIEGAKPPAPTWRLVIADGSAGEDGNVIPGTGTGQLYSILLDDAAVATLHEQSEGASKVRVAKSLPPVQIAQARRGARR